MVIFCYMVSLRGLHQNFLNVMSTRKVKMKKWYFASTFQWNLLSTPTNHSERLEVSTSDRHELSSPAEYIVPRKKITNHYTMFTLFSYMILVADFPQNGKLHEISK